MVEIRVNGRKWYAQEYTNGTADLFYADGSFICSFDSMEELKYFVMGVK